MRSVPSVCPGSWRIGEKQGIAPTAFGGFLQNEILKEYVSRGAYFLPVGAGLKLVVDVLEYCARFLPNWLPIQLCGYHFREAGGNAVQEIAFTLADAITYIEETMKRGLKVETISSLSSYFTSPRIWTSLRRRRNSVLSEEMGQVDERAVRCKRPPIPEGKDQSLYRGKRIDGSAA